MNNLKKIVQIVGVSGSGKSYVTSELAKLDKNRTYICFSELMSKISSEFGSCNNFGAEEIISKALLYVIEHQPTIINTHNLFRVREGIFGIDYKGEHILRCRAYIHLISPLDVIVDRIKQDERNGRKRKFNSNELEFMQRLSVDVTKHLAQDIGSNFYIVKNDGIRSTPEVIREVSTIINDNI